VAARRVCLTVAYHGKNYRGFASQPGLVTVEGALVEAIRRALGCPVELTVAGRTDAGVHAWGQVVTFDVPDDVELDLVRLTRSLNRQCGPTVVVRAAAEVDTDFDARFSARARSYRYHVLNDPVGDPFLAETAWHVPEALELRSMDLACAPLIGEHDYSSFCRRPSPAPDGSPRSLVRRVLEARWHDLGDGLLRFDITANAFCHQMVRSLTGTLVDVGRGRLSAGEVAGILRARDRSAAGTVAPPHGLCLWSVDYDPS